MKKLRLVLVEDHAIVRAGISSLLKGLEDVEIVAEAGDGREALMLIQKHKPDLVLMDITMPGMNGLDAAARAVKDFPNVKVIMLSMHASEEYVLRALRIGASGYLLKDAGTAELEFAIRTVAGGSPYLSPAVSKHIVSDYVRRVGGEVDPVDQLTPRQREVLQLIAEGRTTQEIAHTLHISVKTVETHRSQLMQRLEIFDIPGLVRYAIRIGLITPEQ